MLLSLAGRVLMGYLIYRFFWSPSHIEAAPANDSQPSQQDVQTNALDVKCTAHWIEQFLNTKQHHNSNEEADSIYAHCRDQFLLDNQISADVKRVVDNWLGMDMSTAEDANQIFLAYQLALISPKPSDQIDEQFLGNCQLMGQSYKSYREAVAPLTDYIDINLDSKLNGEGIINEQERQLLNFAEYAQLCKSIMQR